jgi:DNA adenine methylase
MASPFLKWAGGKARLVPEISARLPATFGRYHEPFAGAAAVFFGLAKERCLPGARLNDANAALAECFAVVRDDVEALIRELEALSAGYSKGDGKERARFYYDRRAQEPRQRVGRAARLIFLNRTCYNGLYRVNRSGGFNVPHGRYARPSIVNADNLRDASRALRDVEFTCVDFEEACGRAEPGDLVYLDPPYHPLSATSCFTSYTSTDFGWREQERLAAAFQRLTERRVLALLSNSSHPAIAALYEGYDLAEVTMSRAINSNPLRRSRIPELLISNAGVLTATN